MCYDARLLPFGEVLKGLYRVVGGTFFAISEYNPERGNRNSEAIRQDGNGWLVFEAPAIKNFTDTGGQVGITNRINVNIKPTPTSELLGVMIDGLSVEETEIVSCTGVAS